MQKECAKGAIKKPATLKRRQAFFQVAAPGKLDDANNLAKKLKESGFPVVIETANIRGQEYYRVLVGPEDEQRYSQTMVQQLKRESYLRGDPFLRRVK